MSKENTTKSNLQWCIHCDHRAQYTTWDHNFGDLPICACCLAKYADDVDYADRLTTECIGVETDDG